MYPLYWTNSKGGNSMRYDYDFKIKCIDMYRQGKWLPTPEGIRDPENFHGMIRKWIRIEENNGPEALRCKKRYKKWTPDERLELVAQVIAGKSCKSVAFNAGINDGLLYTWVQKYKLYGYNGLVGAQKGRKPKGQSMKKKMNINNPRPLVESEYEELIRLRAENAYIKAENEVIKKEIALREADTQEDKEAMLQMRIGDTAVTVEWEDNESVQALRDLCTDNPLTIQMSMYGGFEQVGSIGQSLPRDDQQTTTGAGDIVLYSGNQIVVFYGSNSWAYTRLGHITDQNAAGMSELLGNGDVTITISME